MDRAGGRAGGETLQVHHPRFPRFAPLDESFPMDRDGDEREVRINTGAKGKGEKEKIFYSSLHVWDEGGRVDFVLCTAIGCWAQGNEGREGK